MDPDLFFLLGLVGFAILAADHYGLLDASALAASVTSTEVLAASALATIIVAALTLFAVRRPAATDRSL